MTFEEIRRLNGAAYAPWEGGPYDPSQVPSIEEVMALAAQVGRGIEFDIKAVRDATDLAGLADRYGILERSVFNTHDRRVKALHPQARLIYNRGTEPPGALYALGRAGYTFFGSRLDEYSPESIAEVHDACGIVMPHAYDRVKGDEAADLAYGRSIGIDGAQVNSPDAAAAALARPVPTRIILREEAPDGSPAACLVNADNGLGLPGKPLEVGATVVTTDREGCGALPPAAERVRFAGDGTARASEGPQPVAAQPDAGRRAPDLVISGARRR
jgi:hypothetical protein